MIPIDFCASFEPCEKAIIAAERICIFLNLPLMADGLNRPKMRKSRVMTRQPVTMAMIGEAISESTILPMP